MLNNKAESKVSFLGDIMCERPFLKAARKKKEYDFSGFLAPCMELFQESDLVVGNLETPCDPDSPLTKDMFVFNAPIAFVREIKESGIGFVTTASNHCLDRELSGLKSTIHSLDKLGIKHTGTFCNEKDDRFGVVKLPNGSRLAIISYTYGTNYMDNHVMIDPKDYYTINHLTPLFEGRNKAYDGMSYSVRARVTRAIPRGLRIKVNSLLGRSSNISFVDRLQDGDLGEKEQNSITQTLLAAKQSADIVIVCPHFGGQFNVKPGTYVETFVRLFDSAGADMIVGNHPHVVQRIESTNSGMKVAYSLGNVSISLSTPYVVLKDLPDCSVMLHVYISDNKIVKLSFSILIETEQKGFITVYPLYKLYEESDAKGKEALRKKNLTIYNRFLGLNESEISVMKEYPIEF